jgi:transposase
MDMWKPFRNVTKDKAPQAAILFDKFHIMRHLGEALDKVRKAEYARLSGRDRPTSSSPVNERSGYFWCNVHDAI